MRILIEQQHYSANDVEDLLPHHFWTWLSDTVCKTIYVGYYRQEKEVILILPKIFADNAGYAFTDLAVADLATQNTADLLQKHSKNGYEKDFLYRYAMLVYRSLSEYRSRNTDAQSTQEGELAIIHSNIENGEHTELDIAISLYDFYRQNRDLMVLRPEILQNNAFERTNWQKTVNKQTAIFTNSSTPIYTATITKQNKRDENDALLMLFYSTLHYFGNEYAMPIRIESHYPFERIQGSEIDSFAYKAVRLLKTLRHTYFNDKMRRLMTLLQLYYERTAQANSRPKSAFLLSNAYHIVFEDMIDKLLSDADQTAKNLKQQGDGKIVDHLFRYDSLLTPDEVYFVGDSKYYQNSQFSTYNVYKQYTYAKNIIQYHVDLLNKTTLPPELYYRDPLTEGYNITPNFFIQANINYNNFTDENPNFEHDAMAKPIRPNFHFPNRVFDRDTLLVHHFSINFLYVLRAYNSIDIQQLSDFKLESHQKISNFIKQFYLEKYDFYTIETLIPRDIFVEKYFKLLNGKILSNTSKDNYLFLGLSKADVFINENRLLLEKITKDCVINQ
jgi:LlaJI restriction endonuclease